MQVTISTDKELVVDRFHVYNESGVICSILQRNEHSDNSFPLKIHAFRSKDTFTAQQEALRSAFNLRDIASRHISGTDSKNLATYASWTISESPDREISRITGGTLRNKLDFSRKEASIHKKGLYLPICEGLNLESYYCLDYSSFTCYKNSVVVTKAALASLLGLVYFQKQYSPSLDSLRNKEELVFEDYEVFVIENRADREVLLPAHLKAASELKKLFMSLAVSKYEKDQIDCLSNDYFTRIIEKKDQLLAATELDNSVEHLKHSTKYFPV